ncbi:MAG: DUF72 domain-containing protein [Candidatus Eisenbacteria bacterium]|uniref:DUF72 domain-containing protein n=1 Tax=Eiseniibacteriota bacterium TaxID=2212470 RepID=A0A538TZD3_UNCEI|nr:MAG: DUF72 domain-containing protein [Candidatus Eisenbacteria bacterium]
MTATRRAAQAALRIGISGWNYRSWRGVFYPKGLPHRRELEYASRQLNSIEINGTFYSLQRPEYFRRWYEATPKSFLFAVKGSRFVTHMKKLREVETPLANFFASGPLALEEKLGPILWQFGPQWPLDLERLERFLALLPRGTADAVKLARRHDARVKGRAWTRTDRDRPIRHAIEPRHPSWFRPPLLRLLRRHKVALVFADTAAAFPYAEDVTADFVYVRLHGTAPIYAGGYSEEHLALWAARIKTWTCGSEPEDAVRVDIRPARRLARRDAYVYFDNDAKVHAPFDALSLARKLEVAPGCEADLRLADVNRPAISASVLTPEEQGARRAEAAARWRPRAANADPPREARARAERGTGT